MVVVKPIAGGVGLCTGGVNHEEKTSFLGPKAQVPSKNPRNAFTEEIQNVPQIHLKKLVNSRSRTKLHGRRRSTENEIDAPPS